MEHTGTYTEIEKHIIQTYTGTYTEYTDRILYRYNEGETPWGKALQTPRGSGDMGTPMRTQLGWLVTSGRCRCPVSCLMHQAHAVRKETWNETAGSYTELVR